MEGEVIMQKGKTYGRQAFSTSQIKEKRINKIAEEYYILCSIRGTTEVAIKGYRSAVNILVLFVAVTL
jgi:hypothetical protein